MLTSLGQYYVHYHDFNRRMDEWISPSRVTELPSVAGAKHRAVKMERKKKDDERRREEEKKKAAREREILEQEAEEGTRRTRRRKREDGEASPRAGDGDACVSKGLVNTMAVAEIDEHEGMDEASLREHEEVTKVKNVGKIELGQFLMDTWYFSPFPKHVFGAMIDVLYLCEVRKGVRRLRVAPPCSLTQSPPFFAPVHLQLLHLQVRHAPVPVEAWPSAPPPRQRDL